jgi:hypothetical protein
MGELNITKEAWQREMAVLQSDDPGLSMAELAMEFDVPLTTMKRIVAKGIKAGRYRQGIAARTSGAGATIRVPVYEVIKDAEQ